MANSLSINPLKILFICTHNRCRSILCESITNALGEGVLEARSGGSTPVDEIHPFTLKHLKAQNYPTDYLQSQSWDAHEAFAPDVVITVCDQANGESCPVWFGDSVKIHWGLNDPSKLANDANVSEQEADTAFLQVIDTIKARTEQLVSVAKNSELASTNDKAQLKQALLALGAV